MSATWSTSRTSAREAYFTSYTALSKLPPSAGLFLRKSAIAMMDTRSPQATKRKFAMWATLAFIAVVAAYANSFNNGFHFDDVHTITDNPAVRSLRNTPLFFTNAKAFSVLPANRTYRPFVSLSLALDYALGRGYTPFWFHLSTFLCFVALLVLLFLLYDHVLERTQPSTANAWLALIGAACFGLHPAMAETVNYIIQRGDIYCTLGCVTALVLYACYPAKRKFGLYLLPLAFALLSKPPAAVFPLLLFFYVWFFEAAGKPKRLRASLFASLPSIAVVVALLTLQSAMTPKSFMPSIVNPWDYRLTQPFVWLRYFGELFLPIHLNVDTDLSPFSGLNATAALGLLFLAALVFAIWFTAKRRLMYPIAYGLLWFVITQLPTSLYPLSEVENDHRMFFSFPGLILAVVWTGKLALDRLLPEPRRTRLRPIVVACMLLVFTGYAWGVHARNTVWLNEDTLWLDDVNKSPHNGRGLMIYGLTLMNKGQYPQALNEFERALLYTPNYATLEINLGVVNGLMQRNDEAERHFKRAIALAPNSDEGYSYYGRWLAQNGRSAEAIDQLRTAIALNPARPFPHEQLLGVYSNTGNLEALRSAALQTLQDIPGDAVAQSMLAHPPLPDDASFINQSLAQYRQGLYQQSIDSAQRALALRPDSAEAYNNIGAGYGAMQRWDEAIAAEQKALHLRPDLQIAQNNLAAFQQSKSASHTPPGNLTAAQWINRSLALNQAGQYEQSIAAARQALQLDPRSAEAWNNIAAGNEALHRWDAAIDSANKAIALNPDFQLAKNNLAWSLQQKQQTATH